MYRALAILFLVIATNVTGTPILSIYPENQNHDFGHHAAYLGDVNGDMKDDFLILDSTHDSTGYSGWAYVYFGGSDVDTNPDLVLQESASGYLRTALSGPFDFNGDGYGDIALGSPNYYWEETGNRGAVFVYYGGPSLDAIADVTIPGLFVSCPTGVALSSAGHFDPDDEYDDLAVTVSSQPLGDISAAYVFRGGPTPSTEPFWQGPSSSHLDGLGNNIAFIGDRNGDHFGDLVLGAPFEDGLWLNGGIVHWEFDVGRLYFFHGGGLGGFNGTYEDFWTGTAYLGEEIDGNFDFNGDGLDEVIASAPEIHESRMILGNSNPNVLEALPMIPGQDIAGLGDVNADGYDDVAISDFGGDIYVFLGGPLMDTDPDRVIHPEYDYYGPKVWRAGDVNSDGFDDIMVSASWWADLVQHHAVFIYSGAELVSSTPGANLDSGLLSYHGASPNPFNPQTQLTFSINQPARVQVRVFDLRGHLVCNVMDSMVSAGEHTVEWNGRDNNGQAVSSGTYTVQVLGLGRAAGGTLTLVR